MSDRESLAELVRGADEDDLRELFGTLLRRAREHHAIDGHVAMLAILDGNGIDEATYIVKQRGVAVSPDLLREYDAVVEVPTDPFLSYEDIRRRVLQPGARRCGPPSG